MPVNVRDEITRLYLTVVSGSNLSDIYWNDKDVLGSVTSGETASNLVPSRRVKLHKCTRDACTCKHSTFFWVNFVVPKTTIETIGMSAQETLLGRDGLQRLGFSNGQPNATNLPFSDGLYHPLRDFVGLFMALIGIGFTVFTTLCPVKFGVRACIPDSFTFLFDKLQGHDIQMQDLPPAKRPVEDEEEDEPQAMNPISIPLRLLSCFSELADIGKRSFFVFLCVFACTKTDRLCTGCPGM